jgi:hypothetical protein
MHILQNCDIIYECERLEINQQFFSNFSTNKHLHTGSLHGSNINKEHNLHVRLSLVSYDSSQIRWLKCTNFLEIEKY